MSILTSFQSFAKKFEAEFVKLFKKAPSFEQSAQAVIAVAGPALEIVLGAVDPAALPVVVPIISVVQKDMAIISTVTNAAIAPAGSSAVQSVETAINGVKSNLSGLLQLAEVKNSAKASQINSEVTAILNEADVLLSILPAAAPVAPAAPAAA